MAKKFKSDAFEAIHSHVSGLHKIGVVSKETMRRFDESCLDVPEELGPKQIKALRNSFQVSQPVFARYLNTSESTVEKWETGATKPTGATLKLLCVAKKHGLEILV
ncbi:DNA-binding transcriptional regulator [bacterium]|nr:DNA-binding transcriptional regulator [Candidatus Obscuribacter sp.]MBP9093177.1 DNA-binding transcriptional regulator [bacterium]MBP9810884.1 DNA-binding transcriptional regulator [bacterium]